MHFPFSHSCRQLIMSSLWVSAVVFSPAFSPTTGFGDDVKSAVGPISAVQFNREIRPILADKCFRCHGPDTQARKAGLRLHEKAGLLGKSESGAIVVVPGKPWKSELFRRITSPDASVTMPPKELGKPLTPREIALFKTWIEQGAAWGPHWAFLAPQRPALPAVKRVDWCRNPIDRFVLARLERDGMSPSPEAGRETLIRRVSLDLIGLPPSVEEIDAFLADRVPDAYEKLVDRLLSSPRYGEHQARYWMDLARYADTNGYQYDQARSQWPWRDWVIWALNGNMSYRRFTIEQLAGDLLPGATDEQILATGFNRNHPITIEGGVIDEEYRIEYVVDRVSTTASVWMGLTLNCARCHSHKYDPITQREFYQFFDFFNQVPERGLSGFNPRIRAPLMTQHPLLRKRKDSPLVMVMQQLAKNRATHVLFRGEYDKQRERVAASVPAIFPSLPAKAPRNRLGLALWLTDASHPLTARVAVNRYWQQFFGNGIVKTVEDFGRQGEWPTHPQLLDWLAVEFVHRDWDVKALQKLMVTSAAYRQSSRVAARGYERDPENRLLSRGPNLRLDAETVRDQALAVSGLLRQTLGGKPAFPYQPKGLWQELNNRPGYSQSYKQDTGNGLYRRSLYTFWKRTVPPPSMAVFDAPEREFCVTKRSRTNTPLQALVLLHDPQYVEAARHLAARMVQHGRTDRERLVYGFRAVTSRHPRKREIEILLRFHTKRLAQFRANPKSADALLQLGASKTATHPNDATLAAWTSVARLLLNLSETITKE